jgi:hypothetical protein
MFLWQRSSLLKLKDKLNDSANTAPGKQWRSQYEATRRTSRPH